MVLRAGLINGIAMEKTLVYKFGGASVKDASGVRNLLRIVQMQQHPHLIVVVSAMGKTTNALERVLQSWFNGEIDLARIHWGEVKFFHQNLIQELFDQVAPESLTKALEDLYARVERQFDEKPQEYHRDYDRLIATGELLSTRIVQAYLAEQGISCEWKDARQILLTDDRHRQARILWEPTEERLHKAFQAKGIFVTQGFIGADQLGRTTTLGREGSDYSAAVIAYGLKAEEVVIWKDVPGILNGDPKVFAETELLEWLSYDEAIELAYYGATVIHPRTIQPLKKRGIRLHVKSFQHPEATGTLIRSGSGLFPAVPCFIKKSTQALINLSTRDLAFMAEDHLSMIYQILHEEMANVNFSVHSAVSSFFCINQDEHILPALEEKLRAHFELRIERHLTLYTIRHPNAEAIKTVLKNGTEVISQHTPTTYQVILRPFV